MEISRRANFSCRVGSVRAIRYEDNALILELAVLDVRPGEAEAFERAMREARPLIEATPGFAGIELRRCLEISNRYVLLVSWEKLEDHTEGFRQ